MFNYNDGGRSAAGYKGIAGDCATRAIAIALKLPYQQVYDDLSNLIKKIKNRKKHKSTARNGIPKKVIREYLKTKGWQYTATMHIGYGCKVHLKASELPTDRLICQVSKHVVAMIDGVINDTYDCSREGTRCVYGYYKKENKLIEKNNK